MSYKLTKVQEHFWAINEDFVRFFLFEGTTRALLVDTGLGSGDLLSVCAGLTGKPLFVVNTHSDGDHAGGNRQFKDVYMHPAEFDHYYRNSRENTLPKPVWDGDIVNIGTFKFEVIITPGHTPGSIALFEWEKRFVLCGDTVALSPVFMYGDGRSLPALAASLEKLDTMKERIDTIYAFHSDMVLSPDILTEFKCCTIRTLAGEIAGVRPDPNPFMSESALLYKFGRAGLLC